MGEPRLGKARYHGGAAFSVAEPYVGRFQSFLDDPEWGDYSVDPEQSGGYNYRNIAGTNKLSNHAHGTAIDMNWTRNARGSKGDIDPELARRVAVRHGMTWGGDWKNPDPMHFEINPNWQPPQQQNVAVNGAINSARPEAPGAFTPAAPAPQGAFMAAAAPSPAPAKPTLGGAFGSALSGFADAAGGGGHSDTQAALSNANQSALAEEDQRAANALQTVLQRRAPTYG